MLVRWLGTTLLLLTLAACDTAGGLRSADNGPFAPAGRGSGEAVSGLIVGHRLMEVGEYELALKAYLRAGSEEGLNADVLSGLGSANLKLGRLGQAETLFRRAIDEDERFAPAWNNLGVVLMERGEYGEASRVFRTAFALDSGQSDEIRENLRLALANLDNPAYSGDENVNFALVRRGQGDYVLLGAP